MALSELVDFLKFLDILFDVHLKHVKKIGGSGPVFPDSPEPI
jgi:hypothetical protein